MPHISSTAYRQIAAFFVAFAALVSGGATAADFGRSATWIAEPLQSDGAPYEIHLNRVHKLETRLLPVRLASASADISDDQGNVVVRAGAQLVWVPKMGGLKNDRDLYCTFRSLKNQSEPYWRYSTASNKLICLLDQNSDQIFVGYQNCYSFYPAFLIDGKCHAETFIVQSAGYTNIDPKEFKSDLIAGLRFFDGGGAGTIYECAGSKSSCDPITRRSSLEKLPSPFSWLGSDIKFKRVSESRGMLEVVPIQTPREMNLNAPWVAFSIWL
ncbi:hypothetical protein [Sphingomonas sp.]|uniref:hypothetical protein n=1 Tax=Sphingomonas sp. TaxID=28214 RepID=UPI002E12FF92|nr:hypothetical protein [Sphingomonas sp.]